MKILLTSDLHANLPWFDWVTAQAPGFGLVVIAGDLMRQGFEGKPGNLTIIDHSRQIQPLKRWASGYAANRLTPPIAIGTGNHDVGHPETDDEEAFIAGEPLWEHFCTLRPKFILDGETRDVNGIAVTVTPFHWEEDKERTLQAFRAIQEGDAGAGGQSLRRHWLVIHHRPPPGLLSRPGPIFPDAGLPVWLSRFAIDFVASGHDHEAPGENMRHVELVHRTWCINVGQVDAMGGEATPNHSILDTEARTLVAVANGGRVQMRYDLSGLRQ